MNVEAGLRTQRVPDLAVLYFCLFVVMAGYGSTLVVLPSHVEHISALDSASSDTIAFQVGLLTGVYALAQLVLGPLIGRLVDHIGHRRSLLVGLVGLAGAQGAFGLSGSLPALYALRFLGGAASASVIVAATVCVTARTTQKDRTRGMAWFGTSVSLGLVAGPAIAGPLSRLGIEASVGPIRIDGYSIPFLFSAALTLSTAIFSRNRIDGGQVVTAVVIPVDDGSSSTSRPRLASLLGLVATSQFGLAIFEGTFVTYSRTRLSFTGPQTSAVFVVCGAVMALLQVPAAGLLAKALSPLSQVAIGFALMGIGIGALVPSRSYPVVLLMVAILAVGAALVIPNLAALVSLGTRTSSGVALGWKSSAGSGGQFLGPVIGGSLVFSHTDLPFLLAGLLMIAVSGTILAGQSRTMRRALSECPPSDRTPSNQSTRTQNTRLLNYQMENS